MATLTAAEKRAMRRKNGAHMDMNLVALIDVFTILIFFLLSSSGVETLISPKAVDLPIASVEKDPEPAVLLVVSGDDILVDGRRVAGVAEVEKSGSDVIPALEAELKLLGQRTAVLEANRAEQQAVTIMADRQMPYSVLRKLMVSCARASFADVRFAVRKKEA
jgi:biopolymer transport protein ExbD